jgi:hypothetical protein
MLYAAVAETTENLLAWLGSTLVSWIVEAGTENMASALSLLAKQYNV